MKTLRQHCAGGLVVKGGEVLLIAVEKGGRWQLPKGHIEDGETAEEAGIREVREETGVVGALVDVLPAIEYWFVENEQRIHKTVQFFLLDYRSGEPSAFDPHEVSDARWFRWEEAIATLTFENERRVVETAREKDRFRREAGPVKPPENPPQKNQGELE